MKRRSIGRGSVVFSRKGYCNSMANERPKATINESRDSVQQLQPFPDEASMFLESADGLGPANPAVGAEGTVISPLTSSSWGSSLHPVTVAEVTETTSYFCELSSSNFQAVQ